jgi:diguanylate cyclase (GGDEF)-like protein
MTDRFFDEDFRVLTPDAFDHVLHNELKRAVRSQNFLTLVVLDARAGRGGRPDDRSLQEVARLVSREVRETDLLARTDLARLSLVLLDADLENSTRVIDRVMARLNHYEFPAPLSIAVGAACCPTHAVDAESLKREAARRPIAGEGSEGSSEQRSSNG